MFPRTATERMAVITDLRRMKSRTLRGLAPRNRALRRFPNRGARFGIVKPRMVEEARRRKCLGSAGAAGGQAQAMEVAGGMLRNGRRYGLFRPATVLVSVVSLCYHFGFLSTELLAAGGSVDGFKAVWRLTSRRGPCGFGRRLSGDAQRGESRATLIFGSI